MTTHTPTITPHPPLRLTITCTCGTTTGPWLDFLAYDLHVAAHVSLPTAEFYAFLDDLCAVYVPAVQEVAA